MQPILSNYTASITELKKSPSELLKNAGEEPIAILNHNIPSAYLVPAKTYEKLLSLPSSTWECILQSQHSHSKTAAT
jgi:antitoxin StbD